jgi:hypothetical protein
VIRAKPGQFADIAVIGNPDLSPQICADKRRSEKQNLTRMIADPGKGLTAEGAKVAKMQEQKPTADQRG